MSVPPPNHAAPSRLAGPLRLVLVVYWLGLFTASHIPRTPDVLSFAGGDKIMHFSSYALLAMLCALDRQLRGTLTGSTLPRIAAVLALYGVVDELLQYPIDGRTCDPLDWVADILGISVGLSVFVLLRMLRRKLATQ